ncbi:MAG: DUF4394 domain-containing protein [Comamonadaceae bacterium]|nr:MAG: DUF4394 domain-containing protein [Comamonadaceae bacterium]
MKFPRLLAALLAVTLACGLTGCGGDDDPPAASGGAAAGGGTVVTGTTTVPEVTPTAPVATPTVAATAAVGLNASGSLVKFSLATPGTAVTTAVTGLAFGDTLVGIDVRAANGLLYALGSANNLYTINVATGVATLVTSLSADPADLTAPFTTLSGTEFAVDFNPVPDRLRVVSDTGANYRINPANGLVTTDGTLNGGSTVADAAAYTNSAPGVTATATTLYILDASTDSLYIQNPPNNGTLTVIGSLGVDFTSVNGFDIDGVSGMAYAALTVGGTTNLYTINLTTGAATLVGPIGSGIVSVKGLALVR